MATEKATAAKKSAPSRGKGAAKTSERRSDGKRAAPRKRRGPAEIAKRAAQQLLQLTGREAEGVTGLERTDDGWRVEVEVVETRRIPNTTDVLAVYEVNVDSGGNLVGYNRARRYLRSGRDGEGQ